MLLIDAPEGAPYGPVSKAEFERMVNGVAAVMLEPDTEEQDRYGRFLAYVYLPSGVMLNEELLRTGMAKVAVYPPNVRHVERFDAIADSAKQARRGLWATSAFECAPTDPHIGRCR